MSVSRKIERSCRLSVSQLQRFALPTFAEDHLGLLERFGGQAGVLLMGLHYNP
jgi:hypothetical protein